ncbi:MAG: PD-(D/E)XK nuclease family protein, partial [Muribaculaceae bacterium]|nr:PD-(D/E)XK nuclease family protein [Muribaculaceae bacterium]
IIGALKEEIGDEPFDDARVAMVLPDESLLLPLLYSLPDSLGDANLTMGYPLKLTSVTSFLTLLRRMQLLRRDSSTYNGYAFEEVRNLLGHPYAHAIIGTRRIMDFITFFEHRHISVVKDSDLPRLGRRATRLLSPLGADTSPAQVIRYLDDALAMIEDALMRRNSDNPLPLNGKMEIANVTAWRDALARLDDTIEEYGVRLSMAGTLAEAYRLLQGEIVAFEGEPLKGLQVMGMLETRALDFDHLVVVAVNDRTIPRRSRQRSFLPNVLRRGYGLPPVNYAESLFAYYFYRMMSRARKVTLIYDSRPSGMTGGPSRYLLQLDHIYARDRIRHIEYKFALKSRDRLPYVVAKSEETLDSLNAFLKEAPEGERRRNFSASTLKRYIQCPLKFYFQTVKGLRDDPEPSDTLDPITYGNLIHHALEILMIPDRTMRGRWLDTPIAITAEKIDSIIADRDRIQAIVHRIINEEYYHLPPEEIHRPLLPDTEIIASVAVRHIINVLRYDRSFTPFDLYGCEVKGTLSYPLPDGRRLNMTYAIDRIDNAQCAEPDEIRIIDYKTGSSHISAASLEEVFSGDALADH